MPAPQSQQESQMISLLRQQLSAQQLKQNDYLEQIAQLQRDKVFLAQKQKQKQLVSEICTSNSLQNTLNQVRDDNSKMKIQLDHAIQQQIQSTQRETELQSKLEWYQQRVDILEQKCRTHEQMITAFSYQNQNENQFDQFVQQLQADLNQFHSKAHKLSQIVNVSDELSAMDAAIETIKQQKQSIEFLEVQRSVYDTVLLQTSRNENSVSQQQVQLLTPLQSDQNEIKRYQSELKLAMINTDQYKNEYQQLQQVVNRQTAQIEQMKAQINELTFNNSENTHRLRQIDEAVIEINNHLNITDHDVLISIQKALQNLKARIQKISALETSIMNITNIGINLQNSSILYQNQISKALSDIESQHKLNETVPNWDVQTLVKANQNFLDHTSSYQSMLDSLITEIMNQNKNEQKSYQLVYVTKNQIEYFSSFFAVDAENVQFKFIPDLIWYLESKINPYLKELKKYRELNEKHKEVVQLEKFMRQNSVW
ncbi:Hypothetical_protein [Hexamita inflata]|uniref:Hypothetical_protein n=1 Tax=Hexamita inflata TaxID=28002 RepID=A0AA86U3R5_9EUKA|nr:Hypothetical protein HINF_LOCUS27149 [Hexamita inflata]